MGIFCLCPNSVISWLRLETSTGVRGLNLIRSKTARLLRSETSFYAIDEFEQPLRHG
jgi:hypothetical protein